MDGVTGGVPKSLQGGINLRYSKRFTPYPPGIRSL